MGTITVRNESETINRIVLENKEIVLIGTAHISAESAREVRDAIEAESPDHVSIELDSGRYKTLEEGNSLKSMDLSKIIREGKAFLVLANLVLSSFQQKMGAELGTKSGDEMRAALEVAKEKELTFSFDDRPIQTTLQRAWAKCNFWNKLKLLSVLISSAFTNEKISEEELEELKKSSAIENMMGELADFLPPVKEVLIDERDQYLATNIFKCPGKKVVAVIGAGHAPGLIGWLEKLAAGEVSDSLEEISHIPPKKAGAKILPWIIPLLIASLFVLGGIRGWDTLKEMGLAWILGNGICAAVGSIIALARPQTILISFIAAPITSMNPTIGVGFVTGLLEYFFRKPKVEDLENLSKDTGSLKGWYRNRVTRVLLVFFLSSLGSSIGTFWAGARIAMIFAG
ncbi:MAG: TraB/GumN family protein [Spirochaetales bacterium]|nr:TraB/GumN family protein [Spirochaetales bacterium]